MTGAAAFGKYVAIGDSQTEGLLDPDGRGGYRGWADRFADILASVDPTVTYANLAVRGRRIGPIRAEQLGPAQEMAPDLVSVMGGLNDVLRPGFDVDVVLRDLEALLAGFPDATVVTNTFPDLGRIAPVLRRLAPRVERFNEGIRELAARHGSVVVDFAVHEFATDLRIWSADRIHATPLGHALIAAAFADTLGIPGFSDWADPLPEVARPSRVGGVVREVRWLGGSVAPWLLRHARGKSSGDTITAKRPHLLPVAPIFHLIEPTDWSLAETTGAVRPPSLDTEGFVHLSFAHQVAGSANRHLAGAAELVALEVDAALAGSQVLVEDSYGSGTSFPHLYGQLPVSAVLGIHPVTRDADGAWTFTRGASAAAASPGR